MASASALRRKCVADLLQLARASGPVSIAKRGKELDQIRASPNGLDQDLGCTKVVLLACKFRVIHRRNRRHALFECYHSDIQSLDPVWEVSQSSE